jgi:hypothetical protein
VTAAPCTHCRAVTDPERLDRVGLCGACLRHLGTAPTERPPVADRVARNDFVSLSQEHAHTAHLFR